ncbi:MAG: FAD-dependent oxidoreductase [Acidimicrobiales bacterium]|jgi:predicted NAD/FAD-binding protein
MRIAIIGSGVSGLVCAHLLRSRHDVVLYEADDRPGGHSHTHTVELPDATVEVDTGFLVYNERTYPLFCKLLDRLGVTSQPSDMSFSVADRRTGLEWRGSSPSTVFAQRSNLARPAFWQMLADVGRFNRLATGLLEDPPGDDVTLEDVLSSRRFSTGFREWYLVPLGSSIWSAGPKTFTQIPAVTFARFFARHGLLRLRDQPRWRTITGGSRRYVEAILRPLRAEGRLRLGAPVDKIRRESGSVELVGRAGIESFDHVVVATHSDQALSLLSDADRAERAILGAIGYQQNRASLHTDARMLPRNRRAWASWNYHRLEAETDRATLTYHLNQLQGIASTTPVLVSLNRDDAIDPALVLSRMDYAHPVLNAAAVAAQRRHGEINGSRRTWFCGAYWGYGFHEDGVASAVETCRALGAAAL